MGFKIEYINNNDREDKTEGNNFMGTRQTEICQLTK